MTVGQAELKEPCVCVCEKGKATSRHCGKLSNPESEAYHKLGTVALNCVQVHTSGKEILKEC